jgi:hypothetical protein
MSGTTRYGPGAPLVSKEIKTWVAIGATRHMKGNEMKKICIGVVVLAALVLGLMPQAGAAKPTTDSAMREAVGRIIDGTYTQADKDLVLSDPEVASQVPDPEAEPVVEVMSGDPTGSGEVMALATVSCGWWRYVDLWEKSMLGNIIYRWRHYVQWCRNGSVVTKWEVRKDWLVDSDGGVKLRDEGSENWSYGIGTWRATSFRQQHIEFCVFNIGCYSDTYPWSKIWVYGAGGNDYTYGWG